MKISLLSLTIALACTVALRAETPAGDLKFAKAAAIGGMFEIETGQLAEKNGESSGVKEMGAMMVKDHGKAAAELKEIAAKQKIELPSALDAKHQAIYDKLKGLSGKAFDTAYVNAMIPAHETDLAAFKMEAKDGADPELKAFAAKVVPIVEMHLKHFEMLQKGTM